MTVPGLVVFDCDGVLVDSERLNVEIDVRAIRELGWPITREEVIARHLGRSEADALADIASVIGRPVPSEWTERWRSAYLTAYETELVAVPGVRPAIEALLREGWAICVATSGRRSATWTKLATCGLDDLFVDERIFTAADVAHGKPAPDLFLHAADRSGFAPSACVVIEDSAHGVTAATAAGMPCVGFAGGVTAPEQLAAADVVVEDMEDLPAAISALASSPGRGAAGRA